jgi:uncharacterized lipoprotein YmbA
MKKIFVALVAVMALYACSSGEKDLKYRGLSMALPFQTFVDSLQARGFAVDSSKTDSTWERVSMAKTGEKFRLMLAQKDGILLALQENYQISTNDSTRHLWQQLRDDFEKELGAWPNCPILKDDHKVAKFETDGGFVTLTLENTYRPTFSVLYEVKK